MDADDPRHGEAREGLEALAETTLVTHNYVAVEAITLVQRRLGLEGVRDLVSRLLPLVEVHWVEPELHDDAVAAILASEQRQISLVDRVSFEVMRRRNLDRAFVFDPDFERQGFTLVPPC